MGIFIKFECDNCGEYECDCGYELRNKDRGKYVYTNPLRYSNTTPSVTKRDIIGTGLTEDGYIMNEAYVDNVTEEGDIYVRFIDGRYDGATVKWEYDKILKMFTTIEKSKLWH